MADLLKQELGVDTALVRGSGGIFEVSVDGNVVAKKTLDGFPSAEDVLAAVRAALGR